MNRFEQNKPNPFKQLLLWLPSLAFLLLCILFLGGIRSVNETTMSKQQESLESALYRSIVQCYAVEGTYPPSLEYIKSNYGLIYDEALFLVDYQAFGSNLLPEVTVLRRKEQ